MLSFIKPFISAVILPPTSLFLLIFLGLFLMGRKNRSNQGRVQFWGKGLIYLGTCLLWVISCPLFSNWLLDHGLQSFPMTTAQRLNDEKVQAIVVLGAGVELDLPDGQPQLQAGALDRLRYAIQLSRASQIPILVTGGKGWASRSDSVNESDVTEQVAQSAFGYPIRWKESESHDTKESAVNAWQKLNPEGIQKIALVTHFWHMQRSEHNFTKAGFNVIPAPMGQTSMNNNAFFMFFPSPGAMKNSLNAFHEMAGNLLHQ